MTSLQLTLLPSSILGGPKKFIPGLTTFGILATTLQFVGNELRVARVYMLEGRGKKNIKDVEIDSDSTTKSTLPPKPDLKDPSTSVPVDYPSPSEQATIASLSDSTSSWYNRVGSYVSSFSPVRKVGDQEYEDQLNARRQQVLERLREVEGAIANEEAAQKQV